MVFRLLLAQGFCLSATGGLFLILAQQCATLFMCYIVFVWKTNQDNFLISRQQPLPGHTFLSSVYTAEPRVTKTKKDMSQSLTTMQTKCLVKPSWAASTVLKHSRSDFTQGGQQSIAGTDVPLLNVGDVDVEVCLVHGVRLISLDLQKGQDLVSWKRKRNVFGSSSTVQAKGSGRLGFNSSKRNRV